MRFTKGETMDRPRELSAEPPRDEARAALAAAIEQRREAERIARDARQAAEYARGAALDARTALRKARSETIELREGVGDKVDIAAASAREAALARDAEIAKRAHVELSDATERPERELRRATAAAERAAGAVLSGYVEPMLNEIEDLRSRLVGKLGALTVIGAAVAPGDLLSQIEATLGNARNDDLARLAARSDSAADWRAHYAALLLDAGAVPPPN